MTWQVVCRQQNEHVAVLFGIFAVMVSRASRRPRYMRGYERQRSAREMESEVRLRAVAAALWLKQQGFACEFAARCLGIKRRCLVEWIRRFRHDGLKPKPRGRTPVSTTSDQRQRVIWAIDLFGPIVGVQTLMEYHPNIPRAELESILKEYRKNYTSRLCLEMHTLRWGRPGTVWAMDFHEPIHPVDGIYEGVLAVRDLATGNNLLWLPVKKCDGYAVYNALLDLFLKYGAPLVIKKDNGFAFKSDEVIKLAYLWDVTFLTSPPYTPWYNGAAEAGIGTLKTYTHHEAARNDRPGRWTCDDLEAARLRANHVARPRGRKGPSAQQAFALRTPVTPELRMDFLDAVDDIYERFRNEARLRKNSNLAGHELDEIKRRAIAQALVDFGLLQFRRRRFNPPFRPRFWTRIT